MEKEAFEFLSNQAVEASGKSIQTDSAGHIFKVGENVHQFIPRDETESVPVHTLTGMVEFIKKSIDASAVEQLLLEIVSPSKVVLESALDEFGRRKPLMIATLSNETFEFGYWKDREELNIALQSQFVPNEDQGILLKFIGNYKESTEQVASDDGVTQVASVRTGAASVNNVKVPNPVSLAPYRTFTDVKQPESQFVFRMGDGMQGALFEADGGAWKSEAIQRIKKFFDDKLRTIKNVVVLG